MQPMFPLSPKKQQERQRNYTRRDVHAYFVTTREVVGQAPERRADGLAQNVGHAPAADAALSRRQVAADADEFVGKPYGIAVGVSSKFFDLHDLDLAYLQARMALGYKDSIAREREMAGEGGFCNVFSFEESLMYYFLDPAQKDRRFLDFVYATSPVRILHDEDVSSGTSSSSILWHYLRCERGMLR
ncbi:MAG: hypothetical protein E7Z99_06340 [Coriobacteriaceae bacterium]|nr:hypothetical protein [Coriobacteriaceae bacterium]